jgi:hypothetical protein
MPKTAEKAEEKQEALPSTPEPEPEPEQNWASPEDAGGDKDYEEAELPNMRKMVRIRYLTSDEALSMKRLPDLLGFTALAEQSQSDDPQERAAVDLDELERQGVRYNAAVTHRAVMANQSMKDLKCESCGKHHPRSLFTFKQALRLHPGDTDFVVRTALRPWQVGVVPFSKAPTHPDTPVPVSSSE